MEKLNETIIFEQKEHTISQGKSLLNPTKNYLQSTIEIQNLQKVREELSKIISLG